MKSPKCIAVGQRFVLGEGVERAEFLRLHDLESPVFPSAYLQVACLSHAGEPGSDNYPYVFTAEPQWFYSRNLLFEKCSTPGSMMRGKLDVYNMANTYHVVLGENIDLDGFDLNDIDVCTQLCVMMQRAIDTQEPLDAEDLP